MRKSPLPLVIVSCLGAAFVWGHFAYRMYLFIHEYHQQPGVGKAADGVFVMMYATAGVSGALAIVAAFLYQSGKDRFMATLVGWINFIAIWGFMELHRVGALVEYSEWAKMHGV